MILVDRLFNRLFFIYLNIILGIENLIKCVFYEMEIICGCWFVKELEW